MQVGDPVAAGLDALTDGLRKHRIGNGVEQHASGGADQAQRPRYHHDRAQKAYQRIHEAPSGRPRQRQPCNRPHRGHCICENVYVSRPKIGVAMRQPAVSLIGVVVA
jgi:hypothetical protein